MGGNVWEEPELAPTFPAGSQKTVSLDEAFAEDCGRSFLQWEESRELVPLKNTEIRAMAQGVKGKSHDSGAATHTERGVADRTSPAARTGAHA